MINIATTRIHSVESDFMRERSLDRGLLKGWEKCEPLHCNHCRVLRYPVYRREA